MKKIYTRIIHVSLLFCICSTINAQQVNTLYFIKNIEIRSEYNPAFQPIENLYFELPITPNFRFETGNNSLNFDDVIFNQKINGIDSTITFLHPQANKNDFYKKLHSTTRIANDLRVNLFGFGFRVKKNYFTFNIAQRSSSAIYLPKDLFKLLLYGTDTTGTTSYNLNKSEMNATIYSEIAFGYSRKINDKLTLGATFKYLIGQANFSTNIKNFKLTGGIDKWIIDATGSINTSIPSVNIPIKRDGSVNFDNITTSSIYNSSWRDLILTSNYGFGMDVGATYKIIPNLELSASLTDLGFIRWRENLTNATLNANYEFAGLNYKTNDDVSDKIDSIKDVYNKAFKTSATHNKAYTTFLTTRMNLGAEYSVLKDALKFGLLSSTLFANKSLYPEITASANYSPYSRFSSSLSYSFVNGEFNSVGLGLQFKVATVNMYIATDFIPFNYYERRVFNFQAGIIYSFCDPRIKEKKEEKEKEKRFNPKGNWCTERCNSR